MAGRPGSRGSAKERFDRLWERAPNGCWLWTGATKLGRGGQVRGMFWYDGKWIKAHQAAWLIYKGPIPSGAVLRHKCDDTLCVNAEDCLALGTQQQNVADAIERGRRTQKFAPGADHPNSRLTAAAVAEIRSSRSSLATLAGEFGVSKSTIARARAGETWSNT